MTTLADLIAEVAAEHVVGYDGNCYVCAARDGDLTIRWPCNAARLAAALSTENVAAGMDIDWSPFWRETPIEEAHGTHSVRAEFDRLAFAAALLAAITVP